MPLMSLPCYCATLRQAARAVTTLYEEALTDSGLHATQFTALQLLKSIPRMTTTELADAIDWHRQHAPAELTAAFRTTLEQLQRDAAAGAAPLTEDEIQAEIDRARVERRRGP